MQRGRTACPLLSTTGATGRGHQDGPSCTRTYRERGDRHRRRPDRERADPVLPRPARHRRRRDRAAVRARRRTSRRASSSTTSAPTSSSCGSGSRSSSGGPSTQRLARARSRRSATTYGMQWSVRDAATPYRGSWSWSAGSGIASTTSFTAGRSESLNRRYCRQWCRTISIIQKVVGEPRHPVPPLPVTKETKAAGRSSACGSL